MSKSIEEKNKGLKYYFKKLIEWNDVYDMNFQMYAGEFNIYLSKRDVDVFETGGHLTPENALKATLKWIEKVNKVNS